ncbi:MAG: NADH-quinone oxidoreductase subunit A [Vicinamibacteria bacterium]|nr:NADH-quinone oxidoreductase subunit A [Vicinamibacteria bacterium]
MLLASVAFAAGGLIFWLIISPRRKSAEKITTYECGEEPVGTAWVQLNIRFYVVALIFIIFDVEAAFLIPWAVVFRQMDSLIQVALIEGLVFILILAVALAYVWRKGDLAWVRPEDKA